MKNKIITTAASVILGLAAIFASPMAFSQAQYAMWLGVYPDCTGCHASQNNPGRGNVLPGASWNHLAISTPVVPTCTGGQILNSAQTACVTPPPPTCTGGQILNPAQTACVAPPAPTCTGGQILNSAQTACVAPPAPTCTGGQILNSAQTACVAPPAPVVPVCSSTQVLTANVCVAKPVVALKCVAPQILNSAKTACVASVVAVKDTAPVLNAVAQQWDAQVGTLLTIPLSVKDAEQDAFMITGSVLGSKFSAVHPDAAGLPSIDFTWIPTAAQVNKIFTITFQAKETKTAQKLASNKVAVKIRVWATSDKSAASITQLNVITSKWTAGKLTLAGNVVLNSLLSVAEKQAFIAQKLNLTVTASNGVPVGSTTLTLDAKGNWSTVLPVAQTPCDIILQFDGQKAARTVAGCVKPVAMNTAPVIVANSGAVNLPVRFTGGESEGNEREHEGRGERD